MKKINLGNSDFKEIIDKNGYFIDKTLIIKEFLEDDGKIVLLPRPRRFGKTLNLSILRYFLEKSDEDKKHLFDGLKIEKETDIMEHQGKSPVLYLTFKDDKHKNFEAFINIMKYRMCGIYEEFKFIYESLSDEEKSYFDKILKLEASEDLLEIALLRLSKMLNRYYNQKVILLIDEYDTPIHHSHFEGYSDFFGFTEEEINNLLIDFNSLDEIQKFKAWYNGYIFGNKTIYNPWSTLYYLSEREREFKPYWVNTSENSIIKSLLAKSNRDIKQGLEILYNGGVIETTINEDIVMSDIDKKKENIWSFLLLSGYLKYISKRYDDRKIYYTLAIPNEEIMCLYEGVIEDWFSEGFISSDYEDMLKALILGEVEIFEEYFSSYVLNSFSYFDIAGQNPERVYHAFILGILVSLSSTYEVVSNRESGLGRYDVCLIPKDTSQIGIIMEFKSITINSKMDLEKGMEKAIEQINKQLYDTELKTRGVDNIIKLALVFKGKEVLIKEV